MIIIVFMITTSVLNLCIYYIYFNKSEVTYLKFRKDWDLIEHGAHLM